MNYDNQRLVPALQSLLRNALQYDSSQLSPFVDLQQRLLLEQALIQFPDWKCYHYGGYPHAQWQRILIASVYIPINLSDFEIQLMGIQFNSKFNHLHHNQILGKLTNLGIKRSTFGDIITNGKAWQFFTDLNFASLFIQEVQQIDTTPVQLVALSTAQRLNIVDNSSQEVLITPAFRLDAIIARAFHKSRQQAKKLIQSGQVQINSLFTRQVDTQIQIGDTISCHHWGKVIILDFIGQTLTQKYKVYIKIYRL